MCTPGAGDAAADSASYRWCWVPPADALARLQCGMGCNGGFPTGAWRFFKMHGLTTEAKYPYGERP